MNTLSATDRQEKKFLFALFDSYKFSRIKNTFLILLHIFLQVVSLSKKFNMKIQDYHNTLSGYNATSELFRYCILEVM